MTDLTNQYTPRTMVAAMQQSPRPTTFLMDMIGLNSRPAYYHNTKYIELDKVFGNQMVAGYTSRQGEPHVVGKGGFSNHIHVAPYIKERFTLTEEDTEVRLPGTTVYDGITSLDTLMARAMADLRDRFTRRYELQTAQALQTGTIVVSGKDVNYTINFDQDAGHLITLSAGNRWSQTPDYLAQLYTWAKLITDKGAPPPRYLIGESSAMRYLINDTTIRSLLDNRNFNIGNIDFTVLDNQRATWVGHLNHIGINLDLYVYDGLYETTDGSTVTQTRYLDTSRVIMGSSIADVRMHYAKISNLKAESMGFRGDIFPHIWESLDGSQRVLQMESSGMVGLHQPNAFVSVLTES